MLKVGRKGLYLFDNDGRYYQVTPPCVLDFYVHESRQRKGLGRHLFEYMLEVNTTVHNYYYTYLFMIHQSRASAPDFFILTQKIKTLIIIYPVV